MPGRKTLERARKAKREGRAPTTQAGEFLREEMEHQDDQRIAPATGTAQTRPGETPTGTSGTRGAMMMMYEVEGIDDDQLEQAVASFAPRRKNPRED